MQICCGPVQKENSSQRLLNNQIRVFNDAITNKKWQVVLQCQNGPYAIYRDENNGLCIASHCDNSVFSIKRLREHPEMKKNNDGKLPISLAVENGAMSTFQIYVKGLRPNLFRQMMAAGFQPLHKPVQNKFKKEVVDILLAHDRSFLEIKDQNQESPLFANIRNVDFSMVMHLITHGANMNEKDAEGHNVLEATIAYWMTNITWGEKKHQNVVELEKTFIAFIKLFLAMGYKVNEEFMRSNFVKRKGYCFSEEWPRMWSQYIHTINDLQKSWSTQIDEASTEMNSKFVENVLLPETPRGLKVLSLDGGGIRGIASVLILKELENRIRDKLNNQDLLITQFFDFIGGTSTGAIIALALANGYSTMEILQLYLRFKNKVFCGRRNYDPEVLENFLKQEFGENTTMENISKFENLKIMVTATKADIRPPELIVLKNYEITNEVSTTHTLAWFAARCSSAAPTYFSSPDNIHVDGGMMANNPCSDILVEVTKLIDEVQEKDGTRLPISCVVSVGTGKAPKNPSSFPKSAYPGDLIGAHKFVKHIKDFAYTFIEQVSSSDGAVVNRARAAAFLKDAPFFRLSPELPYNIELDCTDDMVILDLMYAARHLISQEEKTFKELVEVLANKIEKDAVAEETLNNETKAHNIRKEIHRIIFSFLFCYCIPGGNLFLKPLFEVLLLKSMPTPKLTKSL